MKCPGIIEASGRAHGSGSICRVASGETPGGHRSGSGETDALLVSLGCPGRNARGSSKHGLDRGARVGLPVAPGEIPGDHRSARWCKRQGLHSRLPRAKRPGIIEACSSRRARNRSRAVAPGETPGGHRSEPALWGAARGVLLPRAKRPGGHRSMSGSTPRAAARRVAPGEMPGGHRSTCAYIGLLMPIVLPRAKRPGIIEAGKRLSRMCSGSSYPGRNARGSSKPFPRIALRVGHEVAPGETPGGHRSIGQREVMRTTRRSPRAKRPGIIEAIRPRVWLA